jgi:uncharacterized membrane protein YagU involved in acid resistance
MKHTCTLAAESVIAGTFGALAMMPVGYFFRALEMRVGHYGPKFAALYLTAPGPAVLFLQHIVLGWLSAVPLALAPLHNMSTRQALGLGAAYGVLYYLLVNSIALPLYFGDPLPWNLGVAVVIPSLVVHVAFGVAVAYAARYWRCRQSAA